MVGNRIRIRLKSFDHQLIENSIKNILEALSRVGAKTSGPIFLSTQFKKYTVLRSPHVDKKARDQFEIRIHKRLIDLLEPDEKVIDVLKGLKLPTGVEVEIK